MPSRADIRPEEIHQDLQFLYLVDVLRDPMGFRYRLVGTKIEEWTGRSYSGANLNEADYGPEWQRIFEDYRQIVETPAPRLSTVIAPWVGREFWHYERFLAPLSSDGIEVDMILGALHITDQQASGSTDR